MRCFALLKEVAIPPKIRATTETVSGVMFVKPPVLIILIFTSIL